jgi:hypothetical protein
MQESRPSSKHAVIKARLIFCQISMMTLGYGDFFKKITQMKNSMQRKEQHNLEGEHNTHSTQIVN